MNQNLREKSPRRPKSTRRWFIVATVLICAAPALVIVFFPCLLPQEGVRRLYPTQFPLTPLPIANSEKTALITTVKRSQELELHFYQFPEVFREEKLSGFWLRPSAAHQQVRTEANHLSGLWCYKADWESIHLGVANLRRQGFHYGNTQDLKRGQRTAPTSGNKNESEITLSRNVFFHVRRIEFLGRKIALVKTEEQWYCPLFAGRKNRLARNPYIGPFEADYVLIKENNRWLIHNSTVPRFRNAWSRKHTALVLAATILVVSMLWMIYRRAAHF